MLDLALHTNDTVKILPHDKPSNTHQKSDNTTSQQILKIQALQQQANDVNRQLNSNIKVPANNNVVLKSVSILFNTADDDKDIDTKVLLTLKNGLVK